MTHLDLFSGIGGFALAARWAGIKTVQFVELDPFCQKVLNKNFPGVPVWDDIKTFHYSGKKLWAMDIGDLRKSGTCAPNAKRTKQSGSIVTPAPLNTKKHEEIKTPKDTTDTSGNGTEKGRNGLLNITVGSVPVVEKQESSSLLSTIKTTTETKREGDLIGKVGSSPLCEGSQTTCKSSVITAITPKQTMEDAHMRIQNEPFLLTAGVPCQPASCAGKRRGTEDDRWLWGETFRVIAEVKPKWCILENVRGLLSLEGGVVFENLLLELETIGYETRTFIIPACAKNAPHRRDRVWIVANSKGTGTRSNERRVWDIPLGESRGAETDSHASDTESQRLQGSIKTDRGEGPQSHDEQLHGCNREWNEPWLEVATRLCTVDDGLPGGLVRPRGWRVNALKAAGNAIVPQIAYQIIRAILTAEEA